MICRRVRNAIAMARAIAMGPGVICLDEPAAGLSGTERAAMIDAIRRIVSQCEMATLIVEHNLDVVGQLCDEIMVLDFGKVIAQGPTSSVLQSEVVRRAYLGDAPADDIQTDLLAGDPQIVGGTHG